MVQDFSRPNLLASMAVMADGTVRLHKEATGLKAFGDALSSAISKPKPPPTQQPQQQEQPATEAPEASRSSGGHGKGNKNAHGSKASSVTSDGSAAAALASPSGRQSRQHSSTGGHASRSASLTRSSSTATSTGAERTSGGSVDEDASATAAVPSLRTSDHTPEADNGQDGQTVEEMQQLSEEEEEARIDAAIRVQAHVRGFLARARVKNMKIEQQVGLLEAGATVWDALVEQNKHSDVIIAAATQFLARDECPQVLKDHAFTRDLNMAVNVSFATGDGELVQGQSLAFLFQKRLFVDDPYAVRFSLLIDTDVASTNIDAPLQLSPALRILDCSTGRMLPYAVEQTLPAVLEPKPQGYVVLGWCSTGCGYTGNLHWKLRAVAKHAIPTAFVKELKPPQCNEEHTTVILKTERRYPLLLQSYGRSDPVHLTITSENLPEGSLVASLSCEGRRIFKRTVKQDAFIPLILPPLSQSDVDAEEKEGAGSAHVQEAPEPKGKAKSAKKKRSAASVRPETRTNQSSEPKRLYELVFELPDVPSDFGETPLPPPPSAGTRRKSRVASAMKFSANAPAFTVRAASMSKIEFAVDTRKQDELKQVVLGWEAADPGRAEKAQALREDLSEQVDRSTAHAVVPRPSELSLRLLDEDLIAQREREKQQKVREFKEQRQHVIKRRDKEAAERDVVKTRTINKANDRLKQNQQERERAGKLRQMYRQRITAKLEAERQAEEERLRKEKEAQEALEAASKSAKKKKKGK